MFCYKCGCEILNDAQFCSKCGTAQKINLSKVETAQSNEYSNEVLKLYFRNLLSLECIKNKFQNDLAKLKTDIEEKENNNYYQCYYLYTDRLNIHKYLHFFYDGKQVKFAVFNNCNGEYGSGSPVINGYCVDMRKDLNYDNMWGHAVTEWLSVEERIEIFSGAWKYIERGFFGGITTIVDKNLKNTCMEFYSDFKNIAPEKYKQNVDEIDILNNDLKKIEAEFRKVNSLLEQAYDVNIVPKQFRNLYAIYYLSDFINTSNESLSTALLNYNLEEIKEKLDEIIEQQQEIIINQALMIAQNEKIMKQNQQQLNYLASIEQNTDRAAQYAQIAANNAEACAWIGLANYINK